MHETDKLRVGLLLGGKAVLHDWNDWRSTWNDSKVFWYCYTPLSTLFTFTQVVFFFFFCHYYCWTADSTHMTIRFERKTPSTKTTHNRYELVSGNHIKFSVNLIASLSVFFIHVMDVGVDRQRLHGIKLNIYGFCASQSDRPSALPTIRRDVIAHAARIIVPT